MVLFLALWWYRSLSGDGLPLTCFLLVMECLADDASARTHRCQDSNGSFTVETTAWEGSHASQSAATPPSEAGHEGWTTRWHDGKSMLLDS